MDFTLPTDVRDLAALVREIVTARLTPERLRSVGPFDADLWSTLQRADILDADLGVLGDCAVSVELGRAVAPVPYVGSVAVGARALAAFGRADLAAEATSGQLLVAPALTEDLADDALRPATRAERAGDGWQLTGSKAAVPDGMRAGLFLVPASTDDGVRVFLARPSDAGFGREPQVVVDGNQEATLDLSAVRVGADDVLGEGDVLAWLLARSTVALCAHQLGVLERALELTAAYAREREQFGRPIGSFQAVSQRLADAYVDVEAVRLTTWEAAWRLSERLPAAAEIATAKFWAADAGHRVAHTAVHIHGGTGIDVDGALHRYFTAAKRNEFALGSATTHLRRLGAELAVAPA
jgi:alkylation response protein AidB-like acyl-CoA dehydrogenase